MSLRSFLDLGGGMTVETYTERWGQRVYIGYAKNASMMFNSPKTLRRFLQLPPKTPCREKLDAWLEEFTASDRGELVPDRGELVPDRGELKATGFGPECHAGELDPSDPNYQTKVVI